MAGMVYPNNFPEKTFKRARLSLGRLFVAVSKGDRCVVENTSIYGSALVMPQVGRSAGWPPRLVILCVRAYFFLAINCFLQWMLVYSLMKEEQVMDKFSGEMWICNFAAEKQGCPEGPGCVGPAGTRITPARLYGFEAWATRNFMKNALLSVFPERAIAINSKVDAGEYGIESIYCRFLCTFLFMILVIQELRSVFMLVKLLWYVPSRADNWVGDPDDDNLTLRVSGMPFKWKVINVLTVVLPKFMLWQFITRTGMIFLIETASIQDTIVNTTALGFILNIDELLFDVFSTPQTKEMLNVLEGLRIEEDSGETDFTAAPSEDQEEVIIQQSGLDRCGGKSAVPWLAVVVVVIWSYFLSVYYLVHCHKSADGTYVSNPMYLPINTDYSHLSAFLPQLFPIPSESTPYWTFHDDDA